MHNLWILDDKFTIFSNDFKAQSTKNGQSASDIYIWADDPEKTKETMKGSYIFTNIKLTTLFFGDYSDYEGSGTNNLFFGSKASFKIANIKIEGNNMNIVSFDNVLGLSKIDLTEL